MALTPDDVVRLAGLARIDLTDDETAYLAPQLDDPNPVNSFRFVSTS